MSEQPVTIARHVRNPQGQGSRLRDDLIAAADRLIARTGDVEGLSLRAVAREVGIATPSIYLHFSDKRSLVQAAIAARYQEFAAVIRAAVAAETDPAAQLRAGCLAYCRFATEHPNSYRVLFGRAAPAGAGQAGPHPPAHRAGPHSWAEGRPDIVQLLADLPNADAFRFLVLGIRRCMEHGSAPAADPVRAATNVWTALHGLVSLRASLPGFPWPPVADQVDDILSGLVGLGRAEAPLAAPPTP